MFDITADTLVFYHTEYFEWASLVNIHRILLDLSETNATHGFVTLTMFQNNIQSLLSSFVQILFWLYFFLCFEPKK